MQTNVYKHIVISNGKSVEKKTPVHGRELVALCLYLGGEGGRPTFINHDVKIELPNGDTHQLKYLG